MSKQVQDLWSVYEDAFSLYLQWYTLHIIINPGPYITWLLAQILASLRSLSTVDLDGYVVLL